jgi:hypothetical protein
MNSRTSIYATKQMPPTPMHYIARDRYGEEVIKRAGVDSQQHLLNRSEPTCNVNIVSVSFLP